MRYHALAMLVTRIGYALIACVVIAAAVAILYVLFAAGGSNKDDTQSIDFESVVNYARYGVIESIDVKGQTMTVHFIKDYDTETQFGTSNHVFVATVPDGQDIAAALTAVGISVGDDALPVHRE